MKQADLQELLNSFSNTTVGRRSDKELEGYERKANSGSHLKNTKVREHLSDLPCSCLLNNVCEALAKKFNLSKYHAREMVKSYEDTSGNRFLRTAEYRREFVKNNTRNIKTKAEMVKLFAKEFSLSLDSADAATSRILSDLGIVLVKANTGSRSKANISKYVRTPKGLFMPSYNAMIAHGKKMSNRVWLLNKLKNDPENFYYCDNKGNRTAD